MQPLLSHIHLLLDQLPFIVSLSLMCFLLNILNFFFFVFTPMPLVNTTSSFAWPFHLYSVWILVSRGQIVHVAELEKYMEVNCGLFLISHE